MVYRYFNEQYGLGALQTRRWKIGRLLELNDPLDCQPCVMDNGSVRSVEYDPFFATMYDTVGIICYSERIDDPVIWSHYADCHRGLALGFEFSGDLPIPVVYPDDDTRATLDNAALEDAKRNGEMAAYLKVISHGFRHKAKSWAYECEYRHFINLSGCDMVGPHYFRGYPVHKLKEVVLGVRCRITVADVQRIMDRWEPPQSHQRPAILKAQIDKRRYTLRISRHAKYHGFGSLSDGDRLPSCD